MRYTTCTLHNAAMLSGSAAPEQLFSPVRTRVKPASSARAVCITYHVQLPFTLYPLPHARTLTASEVFTISLFAVYAALFAPVTDFCQVGACLHRVSGPNRIQSRRRQVFLFARSKAQWDDVSPVSSHRTT